MTNGGFQRRGDTMGGPNPDLGTHMNEKRIRSAGRHVMRRQKKLKKADTLMTLYQAANAA